MLTAQENKRISKLLSYVLRHHPEEIGIALDEQGWTPVPVLLEQLTMKDVQLTEEMLADIVAGNSKQRFTFNEDRSKIRASQGHSVLVNLGYTSQEPPTILFHGTAESFLVSIAEKGLQKGERQQVHLSADEKTAHNVGQRHGKPVVLKVHAGEMFCNGFLFFLSENGVWLTEQVPVKFLQLPG